MKPKPDDRLSNIEAIARKTYDRGHWNCSDRGIDGNCGRYYKPVPCDWTVCPRVKKNFKD